jgi:2-phospho-L-lactate guanylyltransferase
LTRFDPPDYFHKAGQYKGISEIRVTAALLPVKGFHLSKHRLAGLLSPQERAALARAMFDDAWEVLRDAAELKQGLDQLLVVSAEPYVLDRCRQDGVAFLEEAGPSTHSGSVHRATGWAISLGVTSLLSVPIDTPAMTATEILMLVGLARRHSVVVVPSADGTGTNALLRTPPNAIEPHFGPGSCRLHTDEAESKGLAWVVVRPPGLLADIDTPEDAAAFLSLIETTERQATKGASRTAALLREWVRSRNRVPAWR